MAGVATGIPTEVSGVTRAEEGTRCDVCGRAIDVVQVIGTLEVPGDDTGGYASLLNICTYCCARGIQAVTGFKAVRTLWSWYQVRKRYSKIPASRIHQIPDQGDLIG